MFVAKSDDSDCLGTTGMSTVNRTKNISFVIRPSITYSDYFNAVVATLASIGVFYFVFIAGFVFCSMRSYVPRQMEYVSQQSTPSTACKLKRNYYSSSFIET